MQIPEATGYHSQNGMFEYLALSDMDIPFIDPSPTLPSIGNGHDERAHSKITVTNIRWKLTIELTPNYILQGALYNAYTSALRVFPGSATDYAGSTAPLVTRPYQYPPNPNQFYKFRYMMVEFDEDLAIDRKKILAWFYSTFCYYRDPWIPPVTTLPVTAPDAQNTIPGPISVHSNIMRITTPWVGKFKILADKCFEITANRPRVSIDLTIPINRVYTWNDELDLDPTIPAYLISPYIYCFVLPPLSFEQDMSVWDKWQCEYLRTSGTGAITDRTGVVFSWQSWMKLNFIDI